MLLWMKTTRKRDINTPQQRVARKGYFCLKRFYPRGWLKPRLTNEIPKETSQRLLSSLGRTEKGISKNYSSNKVVPRKRSMKWLRCGPFQEFVCYRRDLIFTSGAIGIALGPIGGLKLSEHRAPGFSSFLVATVALF